MNYAKIILESLSYATQHEGHIKNALLISNFKREAKRANDQYFEYEEFFDGCAATVAEWKNNIQSQLRKEQDRVSQQIDKIQRHGYKEDGAKEVITDPKMIADAVRYLESERDSIEITSFVVGLKNTGEIDNSDFYSETSAVKLRYCDLNMIEEAILQAKREEETSQPKANTEIDRNIIRRSKAEIKQNQRLAQILLVDKEQRDTILAKIRAWTTTGSVKKGKDMALLMCALEHKGYVGPIKNADMYRILTAEFGDIGNSKGFDNYRRQKKQFQAEIMAIAALI